MSTVKITHAGVRHQQRQQALEETRRTVLTLAAEGQPPKLIAQTVQISKADVKTILRAA